VDSNVADEANTPGEPTPPPVDPAKGTGFGVVAVVLGGLGCLLPLVPFDLGDTRLWISLPFVLPGLVIGLVGCTGLRRGNALAVAGSILCTVAIGLSAVLLIGFRHNPTANRGPGHTDVILREELDVRFGERHVDPESGVVSVTITLYNKGPYTATYGVKVQVRGDKLCEDSAVADNLAPGASYQAEIGSCEGTTKLDDLSVQVKEAYKSEF